ncbi:hypothetical protein SK128_007871, partial [Halocaridina rubra]
SKMFVPKNPLKVINFLHENGYKMCSSTSNKMAVTYILHQDWPVSGSQPQSPIKTYKDRLLEAAQTSPTRFYKEYPLDSNDIGFEDEVGQSRDLMSFEGAGHLSRDFKCKGAASHNRDQELDAVPFSRDHQGLEGAVGYSSSFQGLEGALGYSRDFQDLEGAVSYSRDFQGLDGAVGYSRGFQGLEGAIDYSRGSQGLEGAVGYSKRFQGLAGAVGYSRDFQSLEGVVGYNRDSEVLEGTSGYKENYQGLDESAGYSRDYQGLQESIDYKRDHKELGGIGYSTDLKDLGGAVGYSKEYKGLEGNVGCNKTWDKEEAVEYDRKELGFRELAREEKGLGFKGAVRFDQGADDVGAPPLKCLEKDNVRARDTIVMEGVARYNIAARRSFAICKGGRDKRRPVSCEIPLQVMSHESYEECEEKGDIRQDIQKQFARRMSRREKKRDQH